MHFLKSYLWLFLFCFSITVQAVQLADDVEAGDSINEIKLPLTQESAAELVHLESKGKVLSVDKKGPYFDVKVLHKNGTVKIYQIDPTTGHAPK